jgi:MGT family glycosyltransferase
MGTEFFAAPVMTGVVAAVGAAGAAAVVTTGPRHDPASVDTGSTAAVVRRWVDQDRVLPRVAAAVTHGGAGTVTGALCHGVPLVVVPQGADQFANARRVEDLGVGIAVAPGAPQAELDSAVASVLRDPGYRAAAQRIARETALLPGVDEAAHLVARVAAPS